MVSDLRAAFHDLLTENAWMDAATRHAAMQKADAILVLLGLPSWCASSAEVDEFYNKVGQSGLEEYSCGLPKRDGMMGGWRKLHNEELHNLYSSPCIIRIIKLTCGTSVGEEERYMLLVGKPEGKRPLGRSRRRWIDAIKVDLLEIGLSLWTGLVWLRTGTVGELL
jgi:hypothetical protein